MPGQKESGNGFPFEGETGPKLWGSRVVGKPYGVSYPLDYEYNKDYSPFVYTSKDADFIEVKCHRCVAFGKYWGGPCEWNEDKASLTMIDVTKQEKIEIFDFGVHPMLLSITHFVPYCRFPKPKPAPMLKHKSLDLRVFYGRFRPPPDVRHETYFWLAKDSYLTVTVDYTQNGTSPEVEECNNTPRVLRGLQKRQEVERTGTCDKK
ncbi:hypothetical protein TSMEX_008459 [Taenia solium]